MTRKLLIAGNWKMNFAPKAAVQYASKLRQQLERVDNVDIMVAPSFVALPGVAEALDGSNISVGAQNVYFQDEGAYTGEVSAPMLKGLVDYVIIGHSERRHIFGEDNQQIAKKVAATIRLHLKAILCVGETLQERQQLETAMVLNEQLTSGIKHLTDSEVAKITIAYEPVWAIGTGQIAKPDQIVQAVAIIRKNISALYGPKIGQKVQVLYGGSSTADTAGGSLRIEGVDGLLVGGASLNAQSFGAIVRVAQESKNKE